MLILWWCSLSLICPCFRHHPLSHTSSHQLNAFSILKKSFSLFIPQASLMSCCPADVYNTSLLYFSSPLSSGPVIRIMKGGVDRDGGRETLREVGFIWPCDINVLLSIMYSAPKLTVSAWLLRLCVINKITWNFVAVKLVKLWFCFSLSVRGTSSQIIMSIWALMRGFVLFFGVPTYLQLTSSTSISNFISFLYYLSASCRELECLILWLAEYIGIL